MLESKKDDSLILDHLYLVDSIARVFFRRFKGRIDLDDLTSEGYLGLIDAVSWYSSEKHSSFKVFAAFKIKYHVSDFALSQSWFPRSRIDLLREFNQKSASLCHKMSRYPDVEDVSVALGWDTPKKRKRLNFVDIPKKIDLGIVDSIKHESLQPFDILVGRNIVMAISKSFTRLSSRERFVIEHYFYLGVYKVRISKMLGVSAATVTSIYKRALKKIKAELGDDFLE